MPSSETRALPAGSARLLRTARLLAGVALLLAIATLAGYVFGSPELISIRPGLRGMSPITATAIGALALATLGICGGRTAMPRVGIAVAALLALAALASHAVADSDRLSAAVAATVFHVPATKTGYVAPGSALAMLLLAASLWFRRARPALADACAGIALLVAGTALLGYAYGVTDLYALPMFNTMALNTAAAFFALALAALMAVPDAGVAAVVASPVQAGAFTRAMLAFVALPALLGALLADATVNARLGVGASMALLVIATIVPLALLILRNGRARIELDAERHAKIELQAALAADLERRLALKIGELEHQTAQREKAEHAANRAQRMEAIGQLTGGIAHDFNNLLQALSGNVTLLQRRMALDDPSRAFADNAAKAIHKGAKLTGQLLAFSRSQRLHVRPVLVRAAVQDALELVRHGLGTAIRLEVRLPADDLWARGDSNQLELALVNLAVNARDAMPEGGVLEISAEVVRDDATRGEDVAIVVCDNGVGMTPEVLNRAIEPFFTTKPPGQGTGLGLAQVYGFVRQCGGDLRIESRPGEGARVTLLLPRVRPEADAEPDAEPLVPGLAGAAVKVRGGILVIDDDASVRAIMTQGLVDAGYEVFEAVDGPSGLAELEQRRPVAAVIDYLMPGMNGAEVARRALLRRPGLPIVFVSGYAETLALEAIPGSVVLRKPFELGALLAALSQALL